MTGSKNHTAIALTIKAIRAMRQGNIKSGQCPHPVIRRKHNELDMSILQTRRRKEEEEEAGRRKEEGGRRSSRKKKG